MPSTRKVKSQDNSGKHSEGKKPCNSRESDRKTSMGGQVGKRSPFGSTESIHETNLISPGKEEALFSSLKQYLTCKNEIPNRKE